MIFDQRDVRSPAGIRASALTLPLGLIPLVVAWSSGLYGSHPPEVSGVALGAHWVCAWALPAAAGGVLAFGSARPPTDHRVMAAGPTDPRMRWWTENGVALSGVALIAVMVTVGQARWSGEAFLPLAFAALVGCAVAVAVAHLTAARLNLGPGVAAGITMLATAVVTVIPYWLGRPGSALAIDVTMYRWMHGDLARGPIVTTGSLIWMLTAALLVVVTRLAPRDIAAIGWTSKVVLDD